MYHIYSYIAMKKSKKLKRYLEVLENYRHNHFHDVKRINLWEQLVVDICSYVSGLSYGMASRDYIHSKVIETDEMKIHESKKGLEWI